jgi:hypothetical protein
MKHFLNDIEISPRDRNEIAVISDFTGNPNVLNISTETLILTRDAYDIVKQHIQTIGVFEGIPYRIELDGGINLNFYVDLTENAVFRDHECEITLKKRNGSDNFFENANATSFELILKKINDGTTNVSFDLIEIPYVIVREDIGTQQIVLLVTIYIMTEQTIDAATKLVDAISDVIEASTPIIGFDATGIPTISFNTGAIITASLKATAQLIYVALLVIALFDLATKLFVIIFPPVRKFNGVRVRELMKKSCEFLGFQFQSTLMNGLQNLTILPVPLVRDRKSIWEFLPDEFNSSFTKGVPSSSDSVSSIGSLFDAMETMFNAKTRVNNGVVRFERRDFWQNNTTAQIVPALVKQNERSDEFTFNTGDIWKRYYIRYALDFTDLHSVDKIYDYHDAEFSTEPTNVVNSDLVLIKNLNEVNIPFSLGARKDRLFWFEATAKALFVVIDGLINLFGGSSNLAASIDDRKNILMISQNYFSQTKMLWCNSNGRQPENFTDFISANALWNNFHSINQIQQFDWKIKTNARIQLNSNDFLNLLDNNFCEINGKMCEILRIEWIDEKSFASITFREPFDYANGKVYTLTINA